MRPAAKWVLLVDDEDEIRQVVREALENHLGSYAKIVEARDGVEAQARLRYQNFDCIVTDLVMPKLNGVLLIQYLRDHAIYKHIPVIAITGNGSPTIRKQYPDLRVILKPFYPMTVATLVQEELDLGLLNERTRANLFMSFLEASENVLTRKMIPGPVVRQPMTIKAPETDMPGDMAIVITTRVADHSYGLCLSFEETLIKNLNVEGPFGHLKADDFLLNFWHQVSAEMNDVFQRNQLESPQFIQVEPFSQKSELRYLTWMQIKGIAISEVTSQGSLHLSILTCPQVLLADQDAA